MIEIYLLQQLVAFAKYGSFSKAAEHLLISQPAITRSMHKLEDELGIVLFNRDGKKVTLNENGQLAVALAENLIAQDQDMMVRLKAFDMSHHSIVFGSCAPFPITSIMPILTNCFSDMRISSEIADEKRLIRGLYDHTYQLIAIRDFKNGDDIFSQHFVSEQLYVCIPKTHPLAAKKTLSFAELKNEKILMTNGIGFWMDLIISHLNKDNLIIQTDMSSLDTMIHNSVLPFFNTNQMIRLGYSEDRTVNIPISNEDAKTTYYIACLKENKRHFEALMSDIRAAALRAV